MMENKIAGGKVFLTMVLAAWGSFAGMDLRDPGDGRAWSAVIDTAAPLVWQWSDKATAATVTYLNLVTGAKSASAVTRGTGALDGEAALPGEGLWQVTLTETADDETIAEKTVRLNVAAAAQTVVLDTTAREYKCVTEPRIYAWSALWQDADSEATTATLAVADEKGISIGSWALPSIGGYGVLSPKVELAGKTGARTVTVTFDEGEALESELYVNLGGFYITVR